MWWTAGTADEITFTTPGAAGEVETAGLVLNIVPRSGGNTRRGSFFASGTGEKLQGDNLTKTLKDQGVMAATPLTKVYDFSGTFGGAIERDRIWYFVNAHIGGNTKDSASVYYNLNAATRRNGCTCPIEVAARIPIGHSKTPAAASHAN
jgi:hypothetical protein